jgi:Secretion system C-terminal sorting domain
MKRTITLMSLLISTISFAQLPTITATNQLPAIDDTIHYSNTNTFGFDQNGSGGAINVVWDYTAFSPTGPADFWFEDPALTPEAANFTTSTVAMATSLGAGYEYFENDASSINRWGYTGSSSLYYNSSFARYTFPITPGVIQSQTYTGTMTSLGAGEDSVTVANGNYQANPDAYGSLTLPPLIFGGQPEFFDSVVRVHVTENFQIIAWIVGTPAVTINVSDDYYFWFDEETQEPIVIYGVTTDDAGGAPITVLRYQNDIAGTGVAGAGISTLSNDANFKIFPNPATSEMNVSFGTSLERTVTLFSIIGEEIETKTTSELSTNFDVSNLPQGVYIIEVSTNNSTHTERVIVK